MFSVTTGLFRFSDAKAAAKLIKANKNGNRIIQGVPKVCIHLSSQQQSKGEIFMYKYLYSYER